MSFLSRARIGSCLVALSLSGGVSAQTWIAVANGNPMLPHSAWREPAHWNTGTVPDSATAVAVFVARNPAEPQKVAVITGPAVTLRDLWFNQGSADDGTSYGYPRLMIGSTRTDAVATGHLLLVGGGIYPGADPAGAYDLQLANGSLELAGQASARTDIVMGRDGSVEGTRRLVFSERSSLRGNVLAAGRGHNGIEFRDQAILYTGTLHLEQSASVVFRDRMTVVAGRIETPEGFSLNAGIEVRDQADVAGLTIEAGAGSGTRLDLSGAAGPVTLRAVSGWVDIVLGANTLVLDRLPQASHFSLAGTITGSGGLTLASSSTASIHVTNANNLYTGPTRITGPGLFVHLFGGGRLNNVTLDGQATLRVAGPSVIGGNLALGNGTLRLSSLTGDGLTVLGPAALGGTLRVEALPETATVGTHRYPFLSATAVTGQFSAVDGLLNTAMLKSRIDYGAQETAVVVEQQSFAAVAGATLPAREFGAYLDSHTGSPSAGVRPLLVTLNQLGDPDTVAASLAGLAPDRYTVLPGLGFAAASARQTALASRLQDAAGGADGAAAFFEAGNRRLRLDATAASPAARTETDTALAGVLWQRGARTLGLFAATDRSRSDLDASGSRARSDETAFGGFGELRAGATFGRLLLATSRTGHDLARRIGGAIDETALAGADSRRTEALLEAGHGFRAGRFTVTPTAGLLWADWRMEDFRETGAPQAALAVSGWSARSLRSRIGLEVAPRTPGRLSARLAVQWLHEFADADGFTARLTGDPGRGYLVSGRPPDRSLLAGSLGVEVRLGRQGAAWLRLGGAHGRHSRTTADFSAGLRWRF